MGMGHPWVLKLLRVLWLGTGCPCGQWRLGWAWGGRGGGGAAPGLRASPVLPAGRPLRPLLLLRDGQGGSHGAGCPPAAPAAAPLLHPDSAAPLGAPRRGEGAWGHGRRGGLGGHGGHGRCGGALGCGGHRGVGGHGGQGDMGGMGKHGRYGGGMGGHGRWGEAWGGMGGPWVARCQGVRGDVGSWGGMSGGSWEGLGVLGLVLGRLEGSWGWLGFLGVRGVVGSWGFLGGLWEHVCGSLGVSGGM